MEHELHTQGDAVRSPRGPCVHQGLGAGRCEPEVLLEGKDRSSATVQKKKKKKNTTLAGISQAIGYHIVGKSRWMGLTETGRGGEGEKKTRGRRKGRGKDRERSLQRPETGFSRSSEP